uniref:CoA-binding protein n=1 Tax=Bellilinea caldifistulae TaxID=360411 RepID=A0A7C4KZ46_9CHLR
MPHGLRPFFAPQGVAIIGASAAPNKLSYGILRNMTLYGYAEQVAPVNPKADEILGLKCYPDIASVPDPLELAVIVLPAPTIPATLEACGQRGIRSVIIISGGFKEVGEEGAALEKQILEIAARYQMRLIGPNCVGTLDLYSGLNTTFIQGVPEKGSIGFISQSGAVGGGVVDYIRNKWIGFSNFASLGNEADLTETDLIEYLSQDEHTRVIAVYVEMIRDGQRFMQVARRVTPHKPIVLLKAGRTSAGARAVSSHTGSLAGSHAAYRAAFQQSGVIEAETVSDLFDISMALAHQPLPKVNRVAIITNAGGPAALLSDSLAEHGLQIADLQEETRTALRGRLNPAAQVANPIDMLGGAEPPEYEFALQQALADPNVDAAVVILVPQALVNPVEVAEKIIQVSASRQKPVLTCFMGEWSVEKARQRLHTSGIPMYVFPEIPGRVLGAMLQYARRQSKPVFEAVELGGIDRSTAEQILAQAAGHLSLGEAQTRPVFAAYGIPLVAGEAVHSPEQAADAAVRLGFPVALKIISPDILHKSDVGGIHLHLNDAQAVADAYRQMMRGIAGRLPQARLEGALVERMADKGQEVIIGMRRDPNFGPLIMFGLGGIYVELFGDVSFRVAPLTRREALDMIHQTHAGKLLSGFRGEEPGDLQAVVDVILRLSQLALDFPQIAEMEINPLRVFRRGALALDGRIILA